MKTNAFFLTLAATAVAEPVDFVRDVQPIFQAHCAGCHGAEKQKSGYRLDVREIALEGGESGESGEAAIVPGKSGSSPLLKFVAGEDEDMLMPPKKSDAKRLSAEQIATLRRWIDEGAPWPDSATAKLTDKHDWWSLKPLQKVAPPSTAPNFIDAFISAKLAEKGLALAPEADARALIRRLTFDLTGLPPTPEEVEAFDKSYRSHATYEALADRLLASPHHGERWARHWLDVVHFGETHGYDKDQPRPNAWPYRDYVIRAFNEDKPYARFVQEQIAGDVLFSGTPDGIEALGFIAAGPWDLIGHIEVPEEKIDGKIARHLDRDDMVANTINTFASLTVHCAQCHDHKFDPIAQADYYSLQAVFAALDRADRFYDPDPAVAAQRAPLDTKKRDATAKAEALRKKAREASGDVLAALEKKIAELKKPAASKREQFGWHSAIALRDDEAKWVQVDLGRSVALSQVALHAASDDFAGIGDGFGFPVRFKVEASDDATFATGVTMLADETAKDFTNPRRAAVSYGAGGMARYVRVTATKLAPRRNDFIFALAEIEVFDASGKNLATGAVVTAKDSIEAPSRWARTNATDGWHPGASAGRTTTGDVAKLEQASHLIVESALGEKAAAELAAAERDLAAANAELAKLPNGRRVYAGTIHTGTGSFKGTGANGGQPRPIFLLARGDVKKPGIEMTPGAISFDGKPVRFELPPGAPEGERRAALARWLTAQENPLVWRSIVNRVWQYHFGRGLVDTPNDFGRMGALPTHPELLDALAVWFRDEAGGSLKKLHRLIVTSATYRQASFAKTAPGDDANNTLLWRASRRKLEAEALRDAMLAVAGKLDLTMGGPSFQDFKITHPEHSPHYEYHLADADDPKLHRRSIYRFLVRSQQQPWMAALDCADPSMLVDKRNQTITPLQALAQLNNQLSLVMARHFAARLENEAPGATEGKIRRAFALAFQRAPSPEELRTLSDYAEKHGLPNACRLLLNSNEFAFAD